MFLLKVHRQLSPELVDRNKIGLKVHSRRTSQELKGLGRLSARNHLVVIVDFSVSLFEKRQPPATIFCRPGKGNKVIVGWEQVVDGDLFGPAFDKHFESKNALLVVFGLMEQTGDGVLILVTEGCHHRQEIVITESSLLKVVIEQLARLLVASAEQRDLWLSGVKLNQVSGPAEIFKPLQVLGQTAVLAWVLFPRQHRLISRERVVREDLAGSFYLRPVDRALLEAVYVEVTSMRLLIGYLRVLSQ